MELIGNFLYVLGGYTGENGAALASGEYADISSGCPSLWQSLPNMNHWRVSAGSGVVADRLFVAGGGRHGSTTNTVEYLAIDPATGPSGSWQYAPSSDTVRGDRTTLAELNGVLYASGSRYAGAAVELNVDDLVASGDWSPARAYPTSRDHTTFVGVGRSLYSMSAPTPVPNIIRAQQPAGLVTSSCETTVIDFETPGVTLTCTGTSSVGAASESVTIKRDATDPTVTIASPLPFAVEPVGLVLDFSALDALSGVATFEATMDDGTTATAAVSGDVVSSAGIYTLTATATDLAGNTSTEVVMFVVYDPAGGFATGGGWIVPDGASSDALDALPALDGTSKATFGFVVKYKNGATTTPIGQLEFVYHVGSFELHSTDYDWLVVTNTNWAKFQGVATIDGLEGLHPFRVDARDGDAAGGSLADRFVIKIWAPGADPDVDEPLYKASGDLAGGKIKIHD